MPGCWIKGLIVSVLLVTAHDGSCGDRPRVAIVIDDMGFQQHRDQAIMALDHRVTIAIIPESPLGAHLARQASRQGREVLVHLPLSGLEHDNCEPVLTCMGTGWTSDRMGEYLAAAFERLEGAVGVNNHQGSRFTGNHDAVANLVTGLNRLERQLERPLVVLDSRTSPTTVLERQAHRAGLLATRRHVFLDHSNRIEDIERSWEALLAMARERGQAVAIGHPRINTLAVLKRRLPELASSGVELAPVSTLACPAPSIDLVDHHGGCQRMARPGQTGNYDVFAR